MLTRTANPSCRHAWHSWVDCPRPRMPPALGAERHPPRTMRPCSAFGRGSEGTSPATWCRWLAAGISEHPAHCPEASLERLRGQMESAPHPRSLQCVQGPPTGIKGQRHSDRRGRCVPNLANASRKGTLRKAFPSENLDTSTLRLHFMTAVENSRRPGHLCRYSYKITRSRIDSRT